MGKRVLATFGLLALTAVLAGCVVSAGSRIQSPPPPATVAVTEPGDAATVAEIDAAAKLNMDNARTHALSQIAGRPGLSVPAQVHLVNVTYRHLGFDNNKTQVLAKLIARPDFPDATRQAIVAQLSKLSFDANRRFILQQINERTQRPPAAATNAPAAGPRTNTAIVPVPRTGGATNRQAAVLQRAKDNPGPCDIAFIGDSITQGWENAGKPVWEKYYGARKCLNFGVGGDRTQHVLWRFENGQLDGIKPKVAVLMLGTNNSNRDDNTEGEILAGVQLVVKQIRERLPETKIILVSIFPRGQTFSPQRGKILQVNQALAKLDDDQVIHYVDFGPQLIEGDGAISRDVMPDYLHLSEKGYTIWAESIEPKLKELLAE